MNTQSFIYTLGLVGALLQTSVSAVSEEDKEMDDFLRAHSPVETIPAAFRALPADKQMRLIDHARKNVNSYKASGQRNGSSELDLFLFGDPEMMKQWADDFLNRRDDRGLYLSQSPELIPMIAPGLSNQDPVAIGYGIPLSSAAATAILHVIANTDAFSAETRIWAQAVPAQIEPSVEGRLEYIEMMRNWWRENERHFQAKDYAAVKRGAPLSEPKPPEDTEPPAASEPLPTVPTVPTPPSPSAVVSIPSDSSPYIIPVAIGLSALLIAATIFIFRRKKSG